MVVSSSYIKTVVRLNYLGYICPINSTPLGDPDGFVGRTENYRINKKLTSLFNRKDALNREIVELELFLQSYHNVFNEMEINDLRSSELYLKDPKYKKRVEDYVKYKKKLDTARVTLRVLNRQLSKLLSTNIVAQADDAVMSTGPATAALSRPTENLSDMLAISPENLDPLTSNNDSTIKSTTLHLEQWLSRPIPVVNVQAAVGEDLSLDISIWQSYFSQPSVRAKLRNYPLMRCTMNVRVAVSATPFHYSNLQFSYTPLDNAQGILSVFDSGLRRMKIEYLSQTPGCVTSMITDNTPIEMHFPYMAPVPMFRLFNPSSAVLGATDDYDDVAILGTFHLYTINPISAVSTDPSPISIYIYAWLTDVELVSTTGTIIEVTTESNDNVDERKVGPVESMSSKAAVMLGKLSNVPVIGRFAQAASIGSSALSKISSLFGWSAPVMTTKPERIKNEPFYNAANLITYDTGKRITLDPKQELTVDPTCIGKKVDEMAISYINSRRSLFHTFTWTTTDDAFTVPIFRCGVTPTLLSLHSDSGRSWRMPTALCFAARPFNWWRGEIKFTFRIVVSKFHRGKIVLGYEPNMYQAQLVDSVSNTNKQFLRVIDLQETQEIEIVVKWNSNQAWLLIDGVDTDVFINFGDVDAPNLARFCNGYIFFTPMTKLQAPIDSPAYINCYVSSDDMLYNEVGPPNGLPVFNYPLGEELKAESDENYEFKTDIINPINTSNATVCHEFFGEAPYSFRALLHRFQRTGQAGVVVPLDTDSELMSLVATGSVYPPPASYSDTLYQYLRRAYIGLRGGVKKRISIDGLRDNTASVVGVSTAVPDNTPLTAMSLTYNPFYIDSSLSVGLHGTVMYVTHTNGGIEFELPFYCQNKFLYAMDDIVYTTNDTFQPEVFQNKYAIDVVATLLPTNLGTTPALFGGNTIVFREYTAFADDFSLLGFMAGVPYYP